jgi:hypothetical protein
MSDVSSNNRGMKGHVCVVMKRVADPELSGVQLPCLM